MPKRERQRERKLERTESALASQLCTHSLSLSLLFYSLSLSLLAYSALRAFALTWHEPLPRAANFSAVYISFLQTFPAAQQSQSNCAKVNWILLTIFNYFLQCSSLYNIPHFSVVFSLFLVLLPVGNRLAAWRRSTFSVPRTVSQGKREKN